MIYIDPQTTYEGHTLCSSLVPADSGMNGLVLDDFTPGDKPFNIADSLVSQQSVHPTDLGTTLYSDAVEAALVGVY
ncbi:hypothetical protein EDM22_04890 [Agromyces tardus]|uniref:Uncharacterized protein n=1 Tax=Agromyces tardus TaxID=2583849 RepID=A0A3M8AJ33_9MICO|nr:hypothetical protein EDM22_04890 [Agromyces tardus]